MANPGTDSGMTGPDRRGFFGALFDFSFDHFISPAIVKFVYAVATIMLALAGLLVVVLGFAVSVRAGVVLLLVTPVAGILYLAFIRMSLEFLIALVRMSEDVHHRLPRS